MGSKTLIYRQKVQINFEEAHKHLKRLDGAFDELLKKYQLPLVEKEYKHILNNIQDLAYSDQIIYRFAKLQDVMGAKLFKSILLYQGETVNKPFLDILNQLEKMEILDVEEWFEIRDLRNEISHDYEDSGSTAMHMLNMIFKLKKELEKILNAIGILLKI